MDEVDVLFQDESFPLQPIGEACPAETQFIFTSATLPEQVVAQIKAEFPSLSIVSGPGLHRVAPNINEILIDCSGKFTNSPQDRTSAAVFENKKDALLKVNTIIPAYLDIDQK